MPTTPCTRLGRQGQLAEVRVEQTLLSQFVKCCSHPDCGDVCPARSQTSIFYANRLLALEQLATSSLRSEELKDRQPLEFYLCKFRPRTSLYFFGRVLVSSTFTRVLLILVVACAEELVLHSRRADWRTAQGGTALGSRVMLSKLSFSAHCCTECEVHSSMILLEQLSKDQSVSHRVIIPDTSCTRLACTRLLAFQCLQAQDMEPR